MNPWIRRTVIAVLALFAPLACAADKPVKIVILGDSTVCDYPQQSHTRGWGQFIADGFKPDSVTVKNFAKSGRSTKTFIKEGLLQKSLDEKPDYALIQFGHNDSHPKERPEATDASTDYKEFLRQYVDSFTKIGAKPIFVTPMHRRTWTDGKLTDELKPYADAMKAVAAEKNVPVIDLWTMSGDLFDKLGDKESADLSCSAKDRTHFSEKGARAMANLVLPELKKLDPRLAERMK